MNNAGPRTSALATSNIRSIGGLFFLAGALIMAFNLWRTVYPREEIAPVTTMAPAE